MKPPKVNAEYELFLASERSYFVLLASPPKDRSDCPNVVMHSVRVKDDCSQLEKSIAIVDDCEVSTVSKDIASLEACKSYYFFWARTMQLTLWSMAALSI
jgi:hypothetical protein